VLAFVDPNKCTACGLCPDICPEVFELTGVVATVKVDAVPENAEAACREAADKCPAEAITLEE
jgi:ferredoxin